MPTKIIKLVLTIALCELVGIVGSLFTTPFIATWYAQINRPQFTPPNWVFGPVWTILFALMGVALYLVWQKEGIDPQQKKTAIYIFISQLVLNLFWSILFFTLHSPLLAFIEIIFLWCAIAASIKKFWPISSGAAWLLVPYLLWVSFAAALNLTIVFMN